MKNFKIIKPLLFKGWKWATVRQFMENIQFLSKFLSIFLNFEVPTGMPSIYKTRAHSGDGHACARLQHNPPLTKGKSLEWLTKFRISFPILPHIFQYILRLFYYMSMQKYCKFVYPYVFLATLTRFFFVKMQVTFSRSKILGI